MKYGLNENKEIIRIQEDYDIDNFELASRINLNIKEKDLEKILQKLTQSGLDVTLNFYSEYKNFMKNEDMKYMVQILVFDIGDPSNRKSISRSFDLKGKEDLKWFEKKINSVIKMLGTKSDFKNLAKIIGSGMSGWDAYSTSFGFSVWTITRDLSAVKYDIQKIKGVLEKYDIKFSNEMSKAHWVFRFVLNKDRANIEKIKKIKPNDFK